MPKPTEENRQPDDDHIPCPQLPRDRVAYFIHLKLTRQYRRQPKAGKRTTLQELTDAWQLPVSTLEHYAKRADKVIQSETGRPESYQERVWYCAHLMETLQWRRGKTDKELGDAWKLDANTIRKYSAEASRLISCDAETIHRDITALGTELLHEAYLQKDFRGFKMVGEVLANVAGISTKHLRHTHSYQFGAGQDSGTLATPEEAARLVRQSFGTLPEPKALPADATKALPEPSAATIVDVEPDPAEPTTAAVPGSSSE